MMKSCSTVALLSVFPPPLTASSGSSAPQPGKRKPVSLCWSGRAMTWWSRATLRRLCTSTANVSPSNLTSAPSTPTGAVHSKTPAFWSQILAGLSKVECCCCHPEPSASWKWIVLRRPEATVTLRCSWSPATRRPFTDEPWLTRVYRCC